MWPLFRSNRSIRTETTIETGLKAIDLITPLHIGDDVLVSGDARSGARVLGNELAYRLMNLPEAKFRVFLYLDSELDDLEIRAKELQEVMPTFKG